MVNLERNQWSIITQFLKELQWVLTFILAELLLAREVNFVRGVVVFNVQRLFNIHVMDA